ncbi:MAG: 4-diphosphocytidyl-2-C-methyl-D-erythritol kinase [Flavobacteriales bacterium]|jgi:4-diphosphocytidyl-2-C-methyl-D-erythritol kinase
MICFPKAKINLGLYINSKRTDGFHNIETIMVPIACKDILEIQELPNSFGQATCKVTGLINSLGSENSCTKAYDLLCVDFMLPSVQMHLHKQIPTGAGLGGGSSDTAYTLNLLNEQFDLKLSRAALEEYAAKIGSDDAFFIADNSKFCEGRGEILKDLPGKNEKWQLVLINPGIHSSTAAAFASIKPNPSGVYLKEIWNQSIDTWKSTLENNFEKSVFAKYPEIGNLKKNLYDLGASYAVMSGSGSTVFGLFKNKVELPKYPSHYFVHFSELEL